MNNHFLKTKDFLQQLNFNILKESETDGIFVIEKESFGIKRGLFFSGGGFEDFYRVSSKIV